MEIMNSYRKFAEFHPKSTISEEKSKIEKNKHFYGFELKLFSKI